LAWILNTFTLLTKIPSALLFFYFLCEKLSPGIAYFEFMADIAETLGSLFTVALSSNFVVLLGSVVHALALSIISLVIFSAPQILSLISGTRLFKYYFIGGILSRIDSKANQASRSSYFTLKQVPNTYVASCTSLLRLCFAAALGLILCYFIINPPSFVPAVATSAVHTLTQSVWQLLQYWKVGSITLSAALIELLTRRLLFEMLGKQMASLLFGRGTCTADNGENTSGCNWAIAEIDANRFSVLDPRRYFRRHLRSSSGTYVYRALKPQFIDRVRIKANSLLELNNYEGLHTLGELLKQTYPSLVMTYWDARSNTIQQMSDVIAERKEFDRKGYTEKNLRWSGYYNSAVRTASPRVISSDRRVWALEQKKSCFAYYCPQLNYSSGGVWQHVQVTSPVPTPKSWVIIQTGFSPQPEPLDDDFDRQVSCILRPNSNKKELAFTPFTGLGCPRKLAQVARYHDFHVWGPPRH
jgi:hypothetical protein